ncbi:winged helix-turn-helix transcriptional regulator [Candidatus Saccharibacteria bacterium]|nr:MAG: winged helix-turn-helix transcriptional regulator [Candidatus Saccharibacteria bacterium]
MRTIYSQEQIVRTKNIAKIIGDSSNVLILYELINFGEKSFNELKRMTDINAVTLSKKLTLLKMEGLVDYRECGIENRYFVTKKSEDFRPLIRDIERLIINK